MEERKEVTPAMMNDEVLRQELRGTNWDKYGVEVVNHYPELLQKLAPKYAIVKKNLKEEEEV